MFRGSRGTDPVDWASVLSHGEPPLIPPLTLKTAAASRVPLHQESLIQVCRRSHRAGCGTCSLLYSFGCSGWNASRNQKVPCRRSPIALARLAGLPQLVGAAWAKAGRPAGINRSSRRILGRVNMREPFCPCSIQSPFRLRDGNGRFAHRASLDRWGHTQCGGQWTIPAGSRRGRSYPHTVDG